MGTAHTNCFWIQKLRCALRSNFRTNGVFLFSMEPSSSTDENYHMHYWKNIFNVFSWGRTLLDLCTQDQALEKLHKSRCSYVLHYPLYISYYYGKKLINFSLGKCGLLVLKFSVQGLLYSFLILVF